MDIATVIAILKKGLRRHAKDVVEKITVEATVV